MKRFSLMAAIAALLGSSIVEASPAFKRYKDALAAYKKAPSEVNANKAVEAYEALAGARSLKGDILARDQYMLIAVGKDKAEELKAIRDARRNVPAAQGGQGGGATAAQQQQLAQLQRDLAATKTSEATLTAEKIALQAEVTRLQNDLRAQTTTATAAAAEIARLSNEIAQIKNAADPKVAQADLITKLQAALAKPTLDERINGVADLISKNGDVADLFTIIIGAQGIGKLAIGTIAESAANASVAAPLEDLAQVLEGKSATNGVDVKGLVTLIKDKASAIKAAGSAIDWLVAGSEIKLGKKGIVSDTRNAISLIKDANDLQQYISFIAPAIAADVRVADEGELILDQSKIDALTDVEKADWESFYADFLAFILKVIQHADTKGIDKNSGGYAPLVELRDGINNVMPKIATGAPKKKADASGGPQGGPAVDPVIARFDRAAIATLAKDAVDKIAGELEVQVDNPAALTDPQKVHLKVYVDELLFKAQALNADSVDLLGIIKQVLA